MLVKRCSSGASGTAQQQCWWNDAAAASWSCSKMKKMQRRP